MNRRTILRTGSFAGAELLLAGGAAFAADDAERAVVARLSVFSGRVVRVRRGGEVRLVASIDDLSAFLDGEVRRKAFPYGEIRAEGNLLTFVHAGRTFRVENVLPAHFKDRLRELGGNGSGTCAHD